MGKEYFSHDCNTRNKKKMAMLLHQEKVKGYGLFWIIVEMFYESSEKWLENEKSTFIAIAKESGCPVDFVKEFIFRCINEYKVFIEKDGKFTSDRVLEHLEIRKDISEKRSLAGKASAASRNRSTSDEQVLTESEQGSTIKVKESKVKESIEGFLPVLKIERFEFSLSLPLPQQTQEAVEMNQVTNTSKKNTQFVQSQWKLFLHERLNDPPERKHQFRKLTDLTSYFINWMRTKFPNKFQPEQLDRNEISSREQQDRKILGLD